ncbi:methyltransferase family protein [Rubellimicrobium aerolatum]|uniref:Methyltransferase family protein n=1 Tax=Rubellimicrobium aerolatum TaxID=490979 RepID=A0ABW0S5W9_9RHOB|nr:isoprenylcysteine carboxylmethyltransferase family protein [Rubellimicrobium aerolatum]MBP1804570.1 protein-S-isoprenylcysteine O-methyltransferase Ste14 [Rubellimicrobium aerolatum]
MRRLDLPPVWLLLFALAVLVLSRLDPWSLRLEGAAVDLAAGLLIGGGALLVAVAVVQMRQARTAVLPRREAAHLVTNGVFGRSRNPIYLGFVMLLLGWVLRLGSAPALALVPLYAWVIERRFIRPEEEALARRFPQAFARYREATRRWL